MITCPLCHKELNCRRTDSNVSYYQCPTLLIRISPDQSKRSYENHYEREYYMGTEIVMERISAFPWRLDNYIRNSKTRLYKMSVGPDNQINGLAFIKELPLINADYEQKLLKRINGLMYFL